MIETVLGRLECWYEPHCDGDWEHAEGVAIESIDNPSWSLKVDIARTDVPGIDLDWIKLERTEQDWLFYRSTGVVFEAACGPLNLAEAIESFLDFVSDAESNA